MAKKTVNETESIPTLPEIDEGELMKDVNVPFITKDTEAPNAEAPTIVLPASAFFDQELGDVIYNKLMKAPVKDYQVLLRLTKLWSTINNISKELVTIRNRLATSAWFTETDFTSLTPEALSDPEYQKKSQTFWHLLNKYIFNRAISLSPLWPLYLDLTNPDWHAKSFLEWAGLSADELDKLDTFDIVKVRFPDETQDPAEALAPAPTPDNVVTPDDILVPNTSKENDN